MSIFVFKLISFSNQYSKVIQCIMTEKTKKINEEINFLELEPLNFMKIILGFIGRIWQKKICIAMFMCMFNHLKIRELCV